MLCKCEGDNYILQQLNLKWAPVMQLEVKITDVAYGLWLKEKLKL